MTNRGLLAGSTRQYVNLAGWQPDVLGVREVGALAPYDIRQLPETATVDGATTERQQISIQIKHIYIFYREELLKQWLEDGEEIFLHPN